jgi:homocysteine S-methyltransferase
MNPIDNILAGFQAMVLDGAFATELEKRDCDLNDPLWSAKILLEKPALIGAVHREYFMAGADCAITASYQATYEGFAARGMSEEEAGKLIRLAVEIARKVRDDFWLELEDKSSRPRPLVAASVGPYGAYLADGSEYRGDYRLDEERLMLFHRQRLQALISAEPDLLACETIPCFAEARALTRLLLEHPESYAWISFTAKDGLHTCNGEKIRDCAGWLDDYEQVAAIGINCTAPQYVSSLINEIKKATSKPIIVYPNSGATYDPLQKRWFDSDVANFGTLAKGWFDDGARILGGCCRTGPEDISAICRWAR